MQFSRAQAEWRLVMADEFDAVALGVAIDLAEEHGTRRRISGGWSGGRGRSGPSFNPRGWIMASEGKPYFRCFCCGMQLVPTDSGATDDANTPVDDGTHWSTQGNWGSTLYDECAGLNPRPNRLEMVVCDWFLSERAERVREYLADGTTRPASFEGLT